jgi:hypothetical protein
MKSGIKGVFAKYGHRSLASRSAQPIILLNQPLLHQLAYQYLQLMV